MLVSGMYARVCVCVFACVFASVTRAGRWVYMGVRVCVHGGTYACVYHPNADVDPYVCQGVQCDCMWNMLVCVSLRI